MEFADVLASRRSCRSYLRDPVPPTVLDSVLAGARRGPTAGNTWAIDLVVLKHRDETDGYWDVTLPAGDRRDRFPWPGLLDAPVLVVVVVDPGAYVRRYAEPDKARTGLGVAPEAWGVPYWWVDAGAAVMAVLLGATDAGLGSLVFGVFDHEAALAEHLGLPDGRRIVGTLALGVADAGAQRSSKSAARTRPDVQEFVHHGRW